jgi:hypothetical protein
MTDSEKFNLHIDMKQMLEMIELNDDNLKIYYPINKDYDEINEEEKSKQASLNLSRSGVISQPWCKN